MVNYPDNKVHGANMGPTWDLSAPDGPHVGPMNLAIRVADLRHNMYAPWRLIHDDVIKWKHSPRYWPFVREFTAPR